MLSLLYLGFSLTSYYFDDSMRYLDLINIVVIYLCFTTLEKNNMIHS